MTTIFTSKKGKPKAPMTAIAFIFAVVVFYPLVFAGLAFSMTWAINQIITDGVTFWPILALLLNAWVILSWVGRKK